MIWNFVRDKRINSEDGNFLRIASFRANRRISLKNRKIEIFEILKQTYSITDWSRSLMGISF